MSDLDGGEIAVVGMAGRFPGAPDVASLWDLLAAGREGVRTVSREEALASGLPPAVVDAASFVPRAAVLANPDAFDAQFFRMTPRDAEATDPQQRVFLECAFEALEEAGAVDGGPSVGVFAGADANGYALELYSDPAIVAAAGSQQISLGTRADFLAPLVAYKLDLRGPSLTVLTACSTSLAAVHVACESLRRGECDVALAGGASIALPERLGYVFEEGGVLSPEGRCRTFDAAASGTVFGSGVGVVALKRLADAVACGDRIRAVIRGSALNNDGAARAGFAAPTVAGQTRVVSEALADGGVDAADVGYVETHGTGTPLGDPIEVAALLAAFGAGARRGECALGALKTNVGHLGSAAGIAGLIKTVLVLEHGEIPANLHFERLNPAIPLAGSPFVLPTERRPWPAPPGGRLAGVSSFGLGGTNVHVVLAEASARAPGGPARVTPILTLGAETASALERTRRDVADLVAASPAVDLHDLAYTLQTGRRAGAHRVALVAAARGEAIAALRSTAAAPVAAAGAPRIAFLFPGQGGLDVASARALRRSDEAFAADLDAAIAGLATRMRVPLGSIPESGRLRISDTRLAQPWLFALQYALVRFWARAGVRADVVLGHSAGELGAAYAAGVLDLESALDVVAHRAQLMGARPPGRMLAVLAAPEDVAKDLGDGSEIAAVNGAASCVVAGTAAAIATARGRLAERGLTCVDLEVSHAFHTEMMAPVQAPFRAAIAAVPLRRPRVAFLSTLDGGIGDPDRLASHDYWAQQVRRPVRFAEAVAAGADLLEGSVLLEIGAGTVAASLARAHPRLRRNVALPSLARAGADGDEGPEAALARLWSAGLDIDWRALHAGTRRLRVALPARVFERERFGTRYVRGERARVHGERPGSSDRRDEPRDARARFHVAGFARTLAPPELPSAAGAWLLFAESPLRERLAGAIRELGGRVLTVYRGPETPAAEAAGFALPTGSFAEYRDLVRLFAAEPGTLRILHAWSADAAPDAGDRLAAGYGSLSRLAAAWAHAAASRSCDVVTLGTGICAPELTDLVVPEAAAVIGPSKVWPQEMPGVRCRVVDVTRADADAPGEETARRIVAEFGFSEPAEAVVALRASGRFREDVLPLELPAQLGETRLRRNGTYVVLGGLGRFGSIVAQHLLAHYAARCVLVGRTAPDSDPVRARRLAELASLPGSVRFVRADVASAPDLEAALAEAERELGRVDGVIHASGTISRDGPRELADLDDAYSAAMLHAKLAGCRALSEVLERRSLDFCLLTSSLSPILGGLGFAAYAASNLALDAWALRRRGSGTPWISVNWEAWHDRELPPESATPGAARHATVMSDDDVRARFEELMRVRGEPRLVLAAPDMRSRMRAWLNPASSAAPVARRDASSEPRAAASAAPPRTPEEHAVVDAIEGTLGVRGVGLHDNLIALGGTSLSAVQIVNRLRETLGFRIPIRTLFTEPTVERMAAAIASHRDLEAAAPGAAEADPDDPEIAALLEELADLPEGEADVLLAATESGEAER